MGQILVKCYEFTESQGGIKAKMRLAMQTGVPSAKAAEEPDAPETVEKFKAAVKEVTGQDAPV